MPLYITLEILRTFFLKFFEDYIDLKYKKALKKRSIEFSIVGLDIEINLSFVKLQE